MCWIRNEKIHKYMLDKGFCKRGAYYYRFFTLYRTVFSVHFEKIKFYENAVEVNEKAFLIRFQVNYPAGDGSWFGIAPDVFCNLRRSGHNRWVNYNSERDGIYLEQEEGLPSSTLSSATL